MSRLVFGGDDVTTRGSAGSAILAATNQTCTLYLDAAATQLATDLQTYPGAVAITTGQVTIDAYSRIPLFYGPNDGTDTLYAVVNGGPATAVFARPDDRIDANAAAIATKLTRSSTSFANLAALPTPSVANAAQLYRTADDAIYESTGSAYLTHRDPSGTYAPKSVVTVRASTNPSSGPADFTCTGTNDEVIINAALAAAGPAGTVLLLKGIYNLGGTINLLQHGQKLMGTNQWLGVASGTGTGYFNGLFLQSGANCDMISVQARKVQLHDLFLNGNKANNTSTSVTQTFTDAVTNGTTTITSATAAFTAADYGRALPAGTNIQAGTTIAGITSVSNATMSQAATGSGSGGTVSIAGRTINCNGIATQTFDSAYDTHIKDVYVFNCAGNGVDVQAGHVTLDRVYSEGNNGCGVHVWGTAQGLKSFGLVTSASNLGPTIWDESSGEPNSGLPSNNEYHVTEATYTSSPATAAVIFAWGKGKRLIGGTIIQPGHEAVQLVGSTIGAVVDGTVINEPCRSATNTYDSIAFLQGPDGSWPGPCTINGVQFEYRSSGAKPRYHINEGTGGGPHVITGCTIPAGSYATGPINKTNALTRVRDNIGFVNEAQGAATIASGSTSVVVTHGLAITPSINTIALTRQNNPTNAVSSVWVSNITATQFTINANVDPGASGLTVGWAVVA